jgi:transcriptional regulator with GAF, ATPase, and Fis domain
MTDPPSTSNAERTTRNLDVQGEAFILRSHKIRIEVLAGPDAGRVLEIPGPEVRVGSAPGGEVVLQDPTVSRHHLTLRVEAERIRVIDAESTNGTWLDGIAIRDAYARPDSRIGIGNTVLCLAMLPDVIEIPLSSRERFGALIGRSPAMRRVFAMLERIAPTEATVLIEGETGTGKELAAEALHDESPRASGPFVVFDCSAVASNLMESDLFGHMRGAFTGAVSDRPGAFEAANGGTLFLDEIGELPLDLQPKLLRALERREVRRLGSNEVRRVDVRIVAATNRSLLREVELNRFREDLYYRLSVIRIALPPLRERREDIPLLIEHFMQMAGGSAGHSASVPAGLIQAVSAQSFRGNVRELKNAVSRALSLGSAPGWSAGPAAATPGPSSVPGAIDLSIPLKEARDAAADAFEKAYLSAALERTGGNVTRAAELAGVNRKFIQRAMKRFDLRGRDT